MPNKQYKLIVFDIDGTILDGGCKMVCARLKSVVSKLKDQGYLFTLATARIPLSALKIAEQLGLNNPVICLNGSLIVDPRQQVIYSKTFALSSLQPYLNTISNSISINYYHEFEWISQNRSNYSDIELAYLEIGDYNPYRALHLQQVNKITLIGDNQELKQAKHKLMVNDSLIVAFSHQNYLEIASSDINKLTGIEAYANLYNVQLNEVIAFGDGENDIPMLSGVGLGVAMGNALEHVKSMAHDIAPNHDQYGVAIYLEGLINQGIL